MRSQQHTASAQCRERSSLIVFGSNTFGLLPSCRWFYQQVSFFFLRFLTSDTLCTQTHRVGHHSRFGPDRLRHFVPECFYDFYNVFIWKARLHQLWCCNGVLCESSAVALVPPSFGFHEVLLTFCRHLQHQHCFGCQMAASVTTTWL